MEHNLKDTKSLSEAIRLITKQHCDSKGIIQHKTPCLLFQVYLICSQICAVVRGGELNKTGASFQLGVLWGNSPVCMWFGMCMCGSVICTLPQRHNPSLQDVTSHSGDAWKENQASPPLSWRRMLQWQVSTLADSHPIIFRPAVLQTAGKWSHSWC